ncbi:hypothetical protein [Citrobacter cronae]|uniref:Uncharacterized protein n=1 Tax=Citrobacter cronae TaxID=1748967 RepID=A0A7X1BTW2_9ENTR|nr:hypothetical protein [Citrobacter cronae]MBC2622755.1 hypothetical protein [Citrobacter cronae]
MSGSDTKAKRDVLSINITEDLKRSAASCRFIDEYRATSDRSAKRTKIVSALTAGQIMQECELMAVIGFIDTEAFTRLDIDQKRMMLLARMQEFIGVTESVAAPVVMTPVAQTKPVAPAVKEPPATTTEEKQEKTEEQGSARVSRFANRLPGA